MRPERQGDLNVVGRPRAPSPGSWLLAAAMALGAVLLFATRLAGERERFVPEVDVPWYVLALGFAASASYALHLHVRAEVHTITLGEIFLVLGLFTCVPSGLLGAQLLGTGAALILVKRLSLQQVAFGLAQCALSTTAAIAIFRAVADPLAPLDSQSWVAAFAACLVASAIVVVSDLVDTVTAERSFDVDMILRDAMLGIGATLVNTMLGLVTVIVLSQSAMSAVLLAGPIAIVFLAYRAYVSERSKSAALEFLYAASEALNAARDLDAGLINLLDFARDAFNADIAEIVLRGDADQRFDFRTVVGPDARSIPLAPIERSAAAVVLDAADESTTAALIPVDTGSALAQHCAEDTNGFAVRSLLLAPLRDENGVRGAVLLGRGRTAALPFAKADLQLFETFSNHLGTTLEKARLNTSLAQLQEAKQLLAFQAYHDSLTGLGNRVLFGEKVGEALDRARRGGGRVGVLFIDLDDFKTVNDTMGHAAGDELLVGVARRISSCLGGDDFAARLGGDEFAVLLNDVASDVHAPSVAQRILDALSHPIEVEGQPVVMRASIGMATHEDAADAAELMQHADVAMYTAKRNGKGRCDEFEPTMSATIAHRHKMKAGLERALAMNEFVVHYQPVIDVGTGELAAVEALLRWQDPERGLLSPNEFVGIAEDTGLIVPIGRHVLNEACRQAAAWLPLKRDLRMFVNLSALQLGDPDIVSDVCEALTASALPPQLLQLEVTESAMMRDIDQAADVLRSVRSIGVGVAIDDFGTGYSSLSYVRQLPVSVLKIAKPIIDAICESDADAAFVRGIVELGHVVGVKVVAEGVEDVEQYARLVDMGCDFVQGFYYASSMAPADVALILASATPVPPAAQLRTLTRR